MSFFRKALNKLSNSDSSKTGALKPSPSTAALPALSFPHGFSEVWEAAGPPQTTVVPIAMFNSDSSRSRISLADKDSGFKMEGNAPLPPPKVMPGSYIDEFPRHRTLKKANSSLSPFLTNLAGLRVSSLDRDNAQDRAQSELSTPLTPEPLSSNASTPIATLPPPPSSKRTRRVKRQQNTEVVALSLIGATYLHPNSSSPVVDTATTKRLEEAANQARLTSGMTTETSGLVRSEDDEDSSIRVEAGLLQVVNEPAPFHIHSLENNVDYPPPSIDDPQFWLAVPHIQEQLDTSASPKHDGYFNRTLDQPDVKEEDISPQALQDKVEPTISSPETHIPDPGDIPDSYSLIDNYFASSSTPPPIPSSPSPQHVTATQQLEDELRLLRSRLAESKARIDALTEEKLHAMQRRHREVLTLSDNVKKLEQKEVGYHTQIRDLVAENERLKLDRDDVVQQLKYQIEEGETLEKANKELQKDSLAFRDFKSKMRDNEIEYQRLFREKDSWQGQIDSMHQRLSDAERRVRCLDIITRQKYDAKQEGAYGSGSTVGRSAKLHFSPHVKGPSMDVVSSVIVFNEEVLQTASYIVEHLEDMKSNATFLMPRELDRAKEVWGSKVVMMLQHQAQNNGSQLNFLLLQNCLEVFMTHWCVHIVEGWYPKQRSFSDILVELTAQTTVVYPGKQQVCGKQIRIIPTESPAPDFGTWVKEVAQDLTSILAVGGIRMPVLETTLLPAKIEPLLKLAYNLRLALAERDICGGLEIAAPSPDVPFHAQFMEDAEESALQKSRKKKADNPGVSWLDEEYIAGTNGVGLKRTLNGQPGVFEMVLKPKVSLIRVLETVF